MNKPRIAYFEQDDVLHLIVSDKPESGSVELSPNVTVELGDAGELIGIEILNASTFGQLPPSGSIALSSRVRPGPA